MAFHVGQKVVCVDARSHIPGWRCDGLTEGGIYTVRWAGIYKDHPKLAPHPCLLLEEVKRVCRANGVLDLPSAQYRFRPLTDRKSEVSFTMGADPESEKWDCRKRVKVRS